MRLIDLDEFAKLSQNHVADLSSLEEELDINYVWDMGYLECLKVLDSCSVIRAIPIEWIKKKSLEFLMNRNFRWATDFQEVIDMWKVENNIPLFDDELKIILEKENEID